MKRHYTLSGLLLCLMTLFTLSASAQDYLCLTANKAGSTVKLKKQGSKTSTTKIQYSTDGTNWKTYNTSTTPAITLSKVGDKVYFSNTRTNSFFSRGTDSYFQFILSGSIAASGNVMSLVDLSCETTTVPSTYSFYRLFYNCSVLTSAPELPATTLNDYCYASMFVNCTSLTTAPKLPATTMAPYCYGDMFNGCSALTTAPALPATTLAASCYYRMFYGCTSLTTAPALPATTLADHCYDGMFYGCKLTSAPELPATTLADHCYYYMFFGCTNLTTAPKLPATTLAASCYNRMFYGCTALTTAPELPVTTLATSCYSGMFSKCPLTSAPELPATTLAVLCYSGMFYDCNALTTAPELPATELADSCYNQMLCRCSSLKDTKVAFSDWNSATNGTPQWVKDVASTGTFSCPEGLAQTTGESGIPEGWTVKNTYDLAITSETGWASMCVNLPLIVPTGVDVYYASAVEGSTIELTQIAAGTVMAAKTAVIVKGAKGTVGFPIAGEAGTSYSGNLFQGSSVDKACNAGENYVLNASMSSDDNVHFSIYTGTTLSDHKAYLPKSAVGGASSIQFRFGDATAISSVETEVAEDVIYNLAGQRVGSDYRGLVIKNGKKVFNN